MTLRRVWLPSPCYSSRAGAAVRLIVLHSAEGATSYQSLGGYFADSSHQASSHVGIDNRVRGTIGEYVSRGNKAWTECAFNPVGVSAELCTPKGASGTWTRADWLNRMLMLDNCAEWVAEEARAFGIPLVRLTPAQAQGTGRGICQHRDLGSAGCGHTDCGPNFPLDYVLAKAKTFMPSAYPPFPYPADHYIGTPRPDPHCHSGCYGGTDAANTRTWQQKMRDRGWAIVVDGCFGTQSETVCKQFQREKGLAADGLVGPVTWAKTWTAPVT